MKTQNSTRHNCRIFFTAVGLTLITAIGARADYQSTVLADNPLAFYAVNPGSDPAGVSPDLTTNGNNGTAFNLVPATGPSAYITNASAFDGSSAFIDLSSGNTLLNFSGPITMEAWAQPANTTEGPANILAKGYDSAFNSEITLRANAGNYFGASYNGPTHGASGGVQTTNWAYLVSTYDGTNWSLYVNNVLVQSNPDATGSLAFSDPWRIGDGSGDYGGSRYFSGNLSEVALYNHGLSATQVLKHYAAGLYGITNLDSLVPFITVQPQSQTTYQGGSATFSVTALSTSPMTNQWFKNAAPLAGQTNSSLTLNNVQPSDATNYSVVIGNSNGTTNSVTVSLVLSAPRSLEWNGASSAIWDTGTNANWLNLANSQEVVFHATDQALFDDTAGVPTNVSVSGVVSSKTVTVNSSTNNFLLNGSGTLTGSGNLIKSGSSTLEMSLANTFTGSVSINGGKIKMDEPLSGAATSLGAGNGAPIVVANGATLALNATGNYPGGNSGLSTRAITISGSGVDGNGALQSVGNDIYHDGSPVGGLFQSLTMTGDATIGSSGRWDLGQEGTSTVISTGGQNYNLTVHEGSYSEWHEVTIDTNLGNIDFYQASGNYWVLLGMGASLGNPTNTITLHGGVTMQLQGNGSGVDNGYAKIIHVTTGSKFGDRPNTGVGDYHLSTVLQMDDNTQMYFFNGDGGSNTGVTLNGTVTLNGLVSIAIGNSQVVFANVISGAGGLVWNAYDHEIVFTAANTYSGPTIIGGGLTMALTGNGSISHSSPIFFGGANSANVSLDVSGRSDQTLTLANGQTLAGVGTVNGNLIVSAGTTLSPSGTNTTLGFTAGTNSTGILAATGAVTLGGTTVMKLNGSGVSDQVQGGTTITYGGTLSLVNISGSPLAVGNSFQIFNAPTMNGTFASITPATPGAGLAWDTTHLNTGSLNVIAGVAGPVIGTVTVSGGNVVLSGTGGPANGNYAVLATTNLTTPLTNWVVLSTSTFDGSGAFHATNPVSAGVPKQFYTIKELP